MVVEIHRYKRLVQFTIPGRPAQWQRRVRTREGHTYMPEQVKNARALVVSMFQQAAGPDFQPHPGPVSLVVTAQWRHAKSPKWRCQAAEAEAWARPMRPDIDNIAKLILDALNGVAYNDDGQVTTQVLHKRYGPRATTDVTLVFHDPAPATKAEWEGTNPQ